MNHLIFLKALRAKSHHSRKLSNQGFTIIELMIVIGILGLLATLVGTNVMGQFKEAKIKAAKLQLAQYQQALLQFNLNHGAFPTNAQGGLQALIQKPAGAGKGFDNYPDGGYLSKKRLEEDPWKVPYRYECEDGVNYSLSSDGPDKNPGTPDDIKAE